MLKKGLIALVVVLLLILGYKAAVDNDLLAATSLPEPVNQVFSKFSLKIPATTEQSQEISSRAGEVTEQIQEVGGRVQQVLGTAIEVAPDSEKPLHERAVDYGKYLYCKQVVEEYEKEQL